jgi:hypothetical protein
MILNPSVGKMSELLDQRPWMTLWTARWFVDQEGWV